MSHDDRIRQLTSFFLEDLRAPIEAAFRQLLDQVMAMADEDRVAAVNEAVARAHADHQAALDAAAQEREQALEALRATLTDEREAAAGTLRSELNRQHEEALGAARDEWGRQHQEALTALTSELALRHGEALDALRGQAAVEHDAAVQELLRTHQDAIETVRRDAAAERDSAVQAVRDELSREHEAAVAALRDQLQRDHEAAVQEVLRSREDAIETARGEAAAEHDSGLQAAREQLGREHEADVAALRDQLQREHEAALAAQREEVQRQHDEVVAAQREQLQREHDEALAALREQVRREHEDAAAREREAWTGEHQAAVGNARTAAEAAAAVAFAALEQERDAARASVAELADQLASARAQHEQLTQLAHAEADAAAELVDGVAVDAHVAERQFELACSERVLGAMRALDEAGSLSEILTALADHAASDAVRVAVLVAQGSRLRGWRLAGMGDVQATSIDVPVAQAGVIGRAVDLAAAVSSSEAGTLDATALPPFLATPPGRVGLALPILVGGRVVAVLYADDGGSGTPVVPSNWPELTEVLARHAARCLEVLTLSRAAAIRPVQEWQTKTRGGEPARASAEADAAGSSHVLSVKETEEQEEESARRHARLLIAEIKLYNQELVERGRRDGNVGTLLHAEIERARRLYEEKIPAAVRQRVDCFDEEIVRTLAGGDRTLLGQVT